MAQCYIFDLDGTLADLSHRLHHIQKTPKDWDGFFADVHKDVGIGHMIAIYQTLTRECGGVIVSGRNAVTREVTMRWLLDNGVSFDALYMRAAGDRRPDYLVKYDLLQQLKADGWEPVMAFDDRDQVVKMWRENGIPCAQVAEGDF